MAWVYKVKYFSYDNILNANLEATQAMLGEAFIAVLRSLERALDDGWATEKKIHIWEDKWLPTPNTHKVISIPRAFKDFPMVSSLIDENTKWWKPDLVNSLFLHFEANEILKIPLSHNLPEDSLIWMGNKRGSFTVKNAYYIAKGLLDAGIAGENSSNHQASPFWKKI